MAKGLEGLTQMGFPLLIGFFLFTRRSSSKNLDRDCCCGKRVEVNVSYTERACW